MDDDAGAAVRNPGGPLAGILGRRVGCDHDADHRGPPRLGAILFGAIFPTLAAWFIVAPLKHMPIAGGWKPKAMMIGPLVNGAWGFGTALVYRLFIKR